MSRSAAIASIVSHVFFSQRVGLRFYNKGSDDKAVLADMKALIAQVSASADEAAYLNGILDREHHGAFDAAYSMGGRRRAATLDEDKYIDSVFKAMISQSERDKKKELAARLRNAHKVLLSSGDDK